MTDIDIDHNIALKQYLKGKRNQVRFRHSLAADAECEATLSKWRADFETDWYGGNRGVYTTADALRDSESLPKLVGAGDGDA